MMIRHNQADASRHDDDACVGTVLVIEGAMFRTRCRQAAAERLQQWRHWVGRFSPEDRALAGNPLQGSCPVCGTCRVRFQDFTANLRESGACSHCVASNRQRQMALVLRRELHLPEDGRLRLPAGCRLYNAESNGALHAALVGAPGYVCSEYWGEDVRPALA